MEMDDREAAYEYQLSSISSVPSKTLTCDLGDPGSYYGPCHVTLLIQFPTFEREIISVKREMVWFVSHPMIHPVATTSADQKFIRILLRLWAPGFHFSKSLVGSSRCLLVLNEPSLSPIDAVFSPSLKLSKLLC